MNTRKENLIRTTLALLFLLFILGITLFLVLLQFEPLSSLLSVKPYQWGNIYSALGASASFTIPLAALFYDYTSKRNQRIRDEKDAELLKELQAKIEYLKSKEAAIDAKLQQLEAALKEVEAAEARISKAVEYLNKHAVTASLDGTTLSLHSAGTGHSHMFERK